MLHRLHDQSLRTSGAAVLCPETAEGLKAAGVFRCVGAARVLVDSLKNPDSKGTMAGHTDRSSVPRDLFTGCKHASFYDGIFSAIGSRRSSGAVYLQSLVYIISFILYGSVRKNGRAQATKRLCMSASTKHRILP